MSTTRTSGGPTPEGPERADGPQHDSDSFVRADQFARAVDSGARTTPDATLNRELAVVAMLRHRGAELNPTRSERDRMRQRLMAEFSSVVHDGNSPVLPLRGAKVVGGLRSGAARDTAARRRHSRVPNETRGRFVVATAAALCLLMSLSGMSLLLSQEALPGDPLYSFKRSAESAELGLTFGNENKALKHLEFADARVSEIELMTQQADANGSWSEGEERFLRALDDFDQDVTASSRLFTALAADGNQELLSSLLGWVKQNQTRLQTIRSALPLAASTRLDRTLELLNRVSQRIAALDHRSSCTMVISGAHDDLGPLPARGICESVLPDGSPVATPLPQYEGSSADDELTGDLMPPGLLAPPSDGPIAQSSQSGQLGLPTPGSDQHVLPPASGRPGGGLSRPALGDPSTAPLLPLQLPNIPLLPLLPMVDPHVE